MSSPNISLSNLLVVNTLSSKNPPHQAGSSEEFSGVITAATTGDSSSQARNTSPLPAAENLQGNGLTATQLLPIQAPAAVPVLGPLSQEQSLLALEAVTQNFKSDSPIVAERDLTAGYDQTEVDILGLERGFLSLIQAVQDGNMERAQLIFLQILRRRSRPTYSSTRKDGFLATSSYQRFLAEMESSLAGNDLSAAQLSVNSFLANIGESHGNFFTTSA